MRRSDQRAIADEGSNFRERREGIIGLGRSVDREGPTETERPRGEEEDEEEEKEGAAEQKSTGSDTFTAGCCATKWLVPGFLKSPLLRRCLSCGLNQWRLLGGSRGPVEANGLKPMLDEIPFQILRLSNSR